MHKSTLITKSPTLDFFHFPIWILKPTHIIIYKIKYNKNLNLFDFCLINIIPKIKFKKDKLWILAAIAESVRLRRSTLHVNPIPT